MIKESASTIHRRLLYRPYSHAIGQEEIGSIRYTPVSGYMEMKIEIKGNPEKIKQALYDTIQLLNKEEYNPPVPTLDAKV